MTQLRQGLFSVLFSSINIPPIICNPQTRENVAMTTSVSGRPRALVTGASSGIGMAFAEHLAAKGYDLILVARRRDRLEELAKRLRRDTGVQADVICANLTDPQGLAEVETRINGDEALSLLINNAGFAGYQPFVSIPYTVIDELIGIHIRAVAHLARAAGQA